MKTEATCCVCRELSRRNARPSNTTARGTLPSRLTLCGPSRRFTLWPQFALQGHDEQFPQLDAALCPLNAEPLVKLARDTNGSGDAYVGLGSHGSQYTEA